MQLHAMQELWELFHCEEDMLEDQPALDKGEVHMAVSIEAVTGKQTAKTLRFQRTIQGVDILILLDSGSSHTFLSEQVAKNLSDKSSTDSILQVAVANGDKLMCSSMLKSATWNIQNCAFCCDIRILPLAHYDMVVGMDWLEVHSPMRVDWKAKCISILYNNIQVVLQGI
ncbi:hypothetical protein QOZ80_1AG0035230 [Eleusine coracana subsp. coracana]|nr:hypothetical protein QOZ80_1AG0035230 [Eleusine coracana subsp. coracana]